MNNSELDSVLKKARMPQPSEEFWELFPRQVARRLNHSMAHNDRIGLRWFPKLTWGFSTVICILLAFAIGHWHGQLETKAITSGYILQNPKFIRETLAMFPNQVRAIVQDKRGLNLVLSENDDVPVSPPIYIRVCDGKNCASYVTFSGQEIQIAGQELTVLSDAHGGIIIAGDKFLWSDTGQVYADDHLKISAKNLGSNLM
jgi:hypothetical protein